MEGHRGAGTGSLGGAREGKTPASPVRGGRARDGEPRGTPGGGNGGAPGTGPTGHSGTAAPRVIPARVATRGDPGTGDDRGARDGGSLGELGTVGDPGGPGTGPERACPGRGPSGISGRGDTGESGTRGKPFGSTAGHTGGYAMSRRGVCGGTIGVARFIRPVQCPTRPFGHSLFY